MKHFDFESEIIDIFRNTDKVGIIVLLKDSTIRFVEQVKVANTGEDQEPWVERKENQIKIEDKLIDFH